MFDYLVVGAGFAGATIAERLAADGDKKVLICDKRPHIGGNAFDHHDEAGILVHKYGPHIFHTNSREVYDYLSKFTGWRPYQHRVLACGRRAAAADPDQSRHRQQDVRHQLHIVRGGRVLQIGGGTGGPGPHVRRRHRQQSGPRAVRKVLSQLHTQAVGTRPVGAGRVRHGARSGPDQPRRSILHGHLSGDAAAWLHPHVRADAFTPEHQDSAERGVSRSGEHDPARRR